VTAIALGPEGQVATVSDGEVRVWNAKGKPIASKAVRGGDEVWFDPAGRGLLVSTTEGKLRAWVFGSGKLHARVGRPGDEVALSPGGGAFATYARGDDGAIGVWKGAGVKKVTELRHEGGVQVVLMSAGADRLLSAGYDGRVIVWDGIDGRSLHVWPHPGAVEAAAFSPNGRYAATVAADEFVRVWDLGSGQELGRFRYGGTARTLFFSADESRLMLASKWWVHCYGVSGGLTPLASRRLGGAWLGEYRFRDPRGASITALVQTTFGGFRCDVLDFGQVTDAPVTGAIATLQQDWSTRTGLGYEGEEVVPLALARGLRASAPRKPAARAVVLEDAVEAF
jgi:WD40 repeat protein